MLLWLLNLMENEGIMDWEKFEKEVEEMGIKIEISEGEIDAIFDRITQKDE